MKGIFPAIFIALLAATVSCTPKSDPVLMERLANIEKKLDSIRIATTPTAHGQTIGTDGIVTHVWGHIIDPPDKADHNKPGKMAKIKLHVTIQDGNSNPVDTILGINNKGHKFNKYDTIGFHLTYNAGTSPPQYYAYDLCPKGKCHCDCEYEDGSTCGTGHH